MLGFLSLDIICSEKRTVFRELEENCEPRGTDNVQGQISEEISAPSGGYCLLIARIRIYFFPNANDCVYYPSNLSLSRCGFENWGISSDIRFVPIVFSRKLSHFQVFSYSL